MVILWVLLAFVTAVSSHNTGNYDMSSCRMTMSCGTGEQNDFNFGNDRAFGSPGKRGAPGIKGDHGQKGGFREYDEDFADIRREISRLQTQKKCPQTKFKFPRAAQVTDYIRIKSPIRETTKFSFCTWFTPSSTSILSSCGFASYATSKQSHNNFLLLFQANKKLNIDINNESKSVTLPISGKTHMCITVDRNQGWAKTYKNGAFTQQTTYTNRNPIPGGGAFIIGQEQDDLLGSLDPNQAYAGTVENMMMWYRVLDINEIRELHRDPCRCPTDYAISLSSDEIQLEGRVVAQPTGEC